MTHRLLLQSVKERPCATFANAIASKQKHVDILIRPHGVGEAACAIIVDASS